MASWKHCPAATAQQMGQLHLAGRLEVSSMVARTGDIRYGLWEQSTGVVYLCSGCIMILVHSSNFSVKLVYLQAMQICVISELLAV